jgi:hypothetical protein
MSLPAHLRSLFDTPEPPELGPGPRTQVQGISALETILATSADPSGRRELVRATVLLWHDHLDAAHEIVQEDEGQDASYIHAVLHRREPDYSNAKYWFRRVGIHPNFKWLFAKADAELSKDAALRTALLRSGRWDAFAFVDACEAAAARQDTSAAQTLRELQRAEFELLLQHLAS